VRPPRSYEPQVGGMGCLFGGIVVRDVLVKLIEYCIEKNDWSMLLGLDFCFHRKRRSLEKRYQWMESGLRRSQKEDLNATELVLQGDIWWR
jgi:hypothetical protein